MNYKLLFSKGKIGDLELKNRIIMTAAGLEMNEKNGDTSEQLLKFYEERAKGGVGAIFSGVCRVSKDETGASAGFRQARLDDDRYIIEHSKLVKMLHKYDCKYFIQLQHPGNATIPLFTKNKLPVSSSEEHSLIYPQKIRSLTKEEIRVIVAEFGDAAYRALKSGADGVELHAAHYYLIHQFLSPTFNKRKDEYGGSTENRFRFLQEIIQDIRLKCGNNYPLIVRISVEEFLGEGSLKLNEGLKLCRLLDQEMIDAISVTVSGSSSPLSHSIEPISYPQGWRDYIFEAVKRIVSKPIIATGVIREPSYAEKLLEEDKLDFIGSFRNFLADPNWANKAKNNEITKINHCISCVRCIEDLRQGLYVSCSVNARAGNEKNEIIPTKEENKKVVIVGGGVGGMEAARVLALRGFKVVLFEQDSVLGGQVELSTAIPHKDKMNWYLNYQRRNLQELNVDVRLNTIADLKSIKEEKPYAVIDATGATPFVPFTYQNNDFISEPRTVLSGKVNLENKHITIIGSGLTGLETALYLAEKGNKITIVEMEDKIAKNAYWVTIKDVTKYLDNHNVIYLTSMKLENIEKGFVELRDLKDNSLIKLKTDHVVLSLGFKNQSTLKEKLLKEFERFYVIGDSKQAGRIKEAVHGGFEVAINI